MITLYHYCSLETFVEIVRSNEVWLTNIFCTNDSAEHSWLLNLAKDHLRRTVSEEQFKYLEPIIFSEEKPDLYCFCMSREGDSLGQWRAYADDGRGVAIGFHGEFLEGLRKKKEDGYDVLRVEPVVYDPETQTELLEGRCANLFANLDAIIQSQSNRSPDDPYRDLDALIAKVRLWSLAAQCKHPSFREEQEVRLIYDRSIWPKATLSQRRFRAKGDIIVPYCALPLLTDGGALVIAEVVFGPKSAWKENEQEARNLLLENGHDKRVHIWHSESTYGKCL